MWDEAHRLSMLSRVKGVRPVERDNGLDDLLGHISQERLCAHTEYLSRLDRTSGGPGERRAAEYICEQLAGWGIDVDLHEFPSYLSYPRSGRVEVEWESDRTVLPGITHAFAFPSPPCGVKARLMVVDGPDGGDGFLDERSASSWAGQDLRGAVVLFRGLMTPDKVMTAQGAGAVGIICVNPGDHPHEMIVSPVWGHPPLTGLDSLPRIPAVSLSRSQGERLLELAARGAAAITVYTQVETDWRTVPLPVVDIGASRAGADFVLLGGHLDSWHLGATDNATGDALLLELARIFAGARESMRRALRVAWWPGHSTGRYSGSAWYADQYWHDLRDGGVAYLNVDSPGVKGATDFLVMGMAELEPLLKGAIGEMAPGGEIDFRPCQPNSDQSFRALGLPSSGVYPMLPRGSGERGPVAGGSGGGWWWHTAEDTTRFVDGSLLERDTAIYTRALTRLLGDEILPLDLSSLAAQLCDTLREMARGNDLFSFERLTAAAGEFCSRAERLSRHAGLMRNARRGSEGGDASAGVGPDRINRALCTVPKLVNPVLYTVSGPFGQDPALPTPLLPGLAPAGDLAGLPAGERGFLLTQLVRQKNRLLSALGQAGALLDEAMESG